eukprot:174542_1
MPRSRRKKRKAETIGLESPLPKKQKVDSHNDNHNNNDKSAIKFNYNTQSYLCSDISLKTTDECNDFNLLTNNVSINNDSTPKLINFSNDNDLVLGEISNLLSESECKNILDNINSDEIQNKFQNMNSKYSKTIRNNSRILVLDNNLSNIIYQKIMNNNILNSGN